LAGIASGVLLTAIQQLEIAPLIRQAEAFEQGVKGAPPSILSTLAANIVLATGFALLLAAAMALRGTSGWRRGLLWGVAGYFVFFVAPAAGLPPELPGTEAGPLRDRQIWWTVTVILSATGLGLAAFAKGIAMRALGLALIAAPHIAGAPVPAIHGSTAPPELVREFTRAAYVANAAFWLALGALVGRIIRPAPSHPPQRLATANPGRSGDR
jgi:cobalt transporter subunit CbtA